MTFQFSNLDTSEKEHVEPVMVSDVHRLGGQSWRFDLWGGSRIEDAPSRDGRGDPGGGHLVAGAHGQPALHPQHPQHQHQDLGQGQDDPVQVQPLLPLFQQWWEIIFFSREIKGSWYRKICQKISGAKDKSIPKLQTSLQAVDSSSSSKYTFDKDVWGRLYAPLKGNCCLS